MIPHIASRSDARGNAGRLIQPITNSAIIAIRTAMNSEIGEVKVIRGGQSIA